MKIHLLPLGARFEYEGQEYVKSGPIFAIGPDGERRLIPKYAVLKPLGQAEEAPVRRAGPLDKAAVIAAFDDFYVTCRQLAGEAGQAELETARRRFLASLDEPHQLSSQRSRG